MKSIKRLFVYLAAIGLCAIAAFFLAAAYGLFFSVSSATPSEQTSSPTISVAGKTIRVAIADTEELRARGLSGREGLAEDEGMLFIFSYDAKHAFWMKDMKFAIDILWLSSDGVIVDMQRSVSPDTYPAAFAPSVPARFVLELGAGFAQRNSVAVGDRVRLR